MAIRKVSGVKTVLLIGIPVAATVAAYVSLNSMEFGWGAGGAGSGGDSCCSAGW